MASQSGKSRSSTGKSASSRTGSASKKKTTGKTTTRKTAARSASTRSASGSRKSSGSTRTSSSKKSSAQKTRSPLRAGGTALLVLAAVLVLLFAVGVRQGKIDVTSGNPISQFADFLMEDIGDDGGEDQPAADDDADREQPEIKPETSVHTTTASAASDTTTAAATTAATTTTTAKESTTTTTTTTTAAKTTTTTKASTTAKTTTTTKATTTTTAAKVTEATDFSVVTTTAAQTTEPKPVYANAEYVADPNYESPYYIVVYAGKSQSVAIYTKDAGGKYSVLTRCFTCSTGAPETPTRTGQYKIRAKYRWRWLQGNVYGQYSSSISSSYLFHSVPYLKESESTLDMNEYDKLGTQASHGCIRLCIRDTKWIYDNCPIGTQVNIVNKSGPSGAGVPSLDYDSKYKGWDPTDPHPDNPYNN